MLRSILVSFFLSFIFLCSGSLLSAQQRSTFYDVEEVNAGAYLGIGVGLDYGGIGVKAEYMATPAFSGFAGVGYNFVGAGVNAGLTYRFSAEKRTRFFLTGMYGYNAVLPVNNGNGGNALFKQVYYGPSAGGGLEFDSRDRAKKATITLLVPFRKKSFREDFNELEDMGVEFRTKPIPVAFSFGYSWALFTR